MNLEYIKSAKRLNSHQARWSLFFSHFNFVLSFRPGSKNVKPDALPRQFSPDSQQGTTESILPAHCLVATAWLVIETIIQVALSGDLGPGNGPTNSV